MFEARMRDFGIYFAYFVTARFFLVLLPSLPTTAPIRIPLKPSGNWSFCFQIPPLNRPRFRFGSSFTRGRKKTPKLDLPGRQADLCLCQALWRGDA